MGVIPDLLLGPEKRLVDIKTVCAKKYYRSGLIRGAAGSGEGRRKRKLADSPRQTPLTETYGAPVDERALTVHSEYFAKAVECDREYNIYDEDAMTGPMCRAIGGRGDVIGMAFGAVGEASSSVLDHAKACAEAISKEAMSEGDVDAVTKDTGYGRVLGEIIRDWGVACAKRRAECLIKLVTIGELGDYSDPATGLEHHLAVGCTSDAEKEAMRKAVLVALAKIGNRELEALSQAFREDNQRYIKERGG